MNIAVMTLTRDRLEYTQHCFETLERLAGCRYHHFVLDQGSTDGTQEWLRAKRYMAITLDENVGIHRGWNMILDKLPLGYDVVVTFDNDCEVLRRGTLFAAASVAATGRWIVSPRVEGLIHPPPVGDVVEVGSYKIGRFNALGGIFRAMPGPFAYNFRFDETAPIWGTDEATVGQAAALQGMGMGYLMDWNVNHYETTSGQRERYPSYFERKDQEYAA